MWLIIYQTIQAILLASVAVFISDSAASRVKYSPLPPFAPRLVQSLYLLLGAGYLFTLFTIENTLTVDWLSLLLMILAAVIVIKGVVDKRESERQPGFLPVGLYRYLRHPIYTGLTLFIIGIMVITITHAHFTVGLLMALAAGGILVFLYANAQKEEERSKEKYGQEFVLYQQTIYAILPIKKLPLGDQDPVKNE